MTVLLHCRYKRSFDLRFELGTIFLMANDEHLSSSFAFMYSKTNIERTGYFYGRDICRGRRSLPSLSFAPFRCCCPLSAAERFNFI